MTVADTPAAGIPAGPGENWWKKHGHPNMVKDLPSRPRFTYMVLRAAFPGGAFFDDEGRELDQTPDAMSTMEKIPLAIHAAATNLDSFFLDVTKDLPSLETRAEYFQLFQTTTLILTHWEADATPDEHVNWLKHVEKLLVTFRPLLEWNTMGAMLARARESNSPLRQRLESDLYTEAAMRLDYGPIETTDVRALIHELGCFDEPEETDIVNGFVANWTSSAEPRSESHVPPQRPQKPRRSKKSSKAKKAKKSGV